MSKISRDLIRNKCSFLVAFAGIVFAVAAVFLWLAATPVGSQIRRPARKPTAQANRYSAFRHDVKAHKFECATCHKFPSGNWNKVRAGDAAFPDITEYPKHESCLGCHKQQFFRGSPPPICSICHVNPSPRDGRRHPFPNPREIFDTSAKGKTASSDFVIKFPHDKHIEIVTARASRSVFRNAAWTPAPPAEESCVVCHKTLAPQGDGAEEFMTPPPAKLGDAFWLKKGTFKSVPLGHTTCFTCHSADSGITPAPSDCATCHQLRPAQPPADFDAKLAASMKLADKPALDAWRRRDSSGRFRHEWTSHADLSCSTCHSVEKMVTSDPATKRVMLVSCAMCHVTATSDDGGALNFEIDARRKDAAFACTKCHITFGRSAIPPSHLQALAEAGGK